MQKTLEFNYYKPNDPATKNIIHSIWQMDRFTSYVKEYIIPKGIVEIIFNFSDGSPIIAQFENRKYQLPKCFINGYNTMAIQIQPPKHQVFFGIQFLPLSIKKIFGTPASEFSDIAVDITLLDPSFNSLWHQVVEQENFDDRVAVFLAWVKRNFIEWHPQEQLINKFLYTVNQDEYSVKALADYLCYSPRQLSRKLSEATTMNTEEILLYKKYLHAVHLMHHTDLSLTAIAYQSRFSDQSHFIKSFRAYTKMTPGEYRGIKSANQGHIYQNVR
jgi:AraC-like DNA-binding protein